MYRSRENTKKRQYNQRILEVEQGSFSPVIFSCSGGTSDEASKCLKRLAQLISAKKGDDYSKVINFIRRRISFDIMKKCIISLRGYRKPKENSALSDVEYGLCHL